MLIKLPTGTKWVRGKSNCDKPLCLLGLYIWAYEEPQWGSIYASICKSNPISGCKTLQNTKKKCFILHILTKKTLILVLAKSVQIYTTATVIVHILF